ncbi:MAG TPA: ATP-binding cassette domain-containing protein [Pyrinomonadaceae bacterium]|nr:ATP-binding cassette domain-containing protein [Pyrinomonadaceae bacterium]
MDEQNVTLRVENVTKRYGEFTAVEDLSFDIRAGKVFGFLGPNGAGKTTTIRMIVGITAPDAGKIELFGEKVSSAIQDKIGYLPEERGLYKKMKIFEQLRYFAALKDIPQKTADGRIDFWLERFKLQEWKKKKANDLSKGMQQKIQFISTVLHEPDLLILDEPFSGLDPINVETLLEVIAELKANGKTIIFSTHLMETAEKLCDDIILMNKSRKIVGGKLRDVKASFGKNIIALRAVGGDEILQNKNLVAKVIEHADEREIFLNDNADAQELLQKLIQSGAQITKFELVEPSLNDIFIEKIGAGTSLL